MLSEGWTQPGGQLQARTSAETCNHLALEKEEELLAAWLSSIRTRQLIIVWRRPEIINSAAVETKTNTAHLPSQALRLWQLRGCTGHNAEARWWQDYDHPRHGQTRPRGFAKLFEFGVSVIWDVQWLDCSIVHQGLRHDGVSRRELQHHLNDSRENEREAAKIECQGCSSCFMKGIAGNELQHSHFVVSCTWLGCQGETQTQFLYLMH